MTVSSVTGWQVSPNHLRAVGVALAGLIAAVLFRAPVLLVLAAPFAMVAVAGTLGRPDRDPELAGRLAPTTVREGDATTWTGILTGTAGSDHVIASSVRRPWIETRPASGIATADARDPETEVDLTVRATHWGRHEVGPVDVVVVAPWAAFRWAALDRDHTLTAVPLPEVFDAAPSSHRADGLVGIHRSNHEGEGNEFAGLRPFRTGDRLRRINWRRSLRQGELHVTTTHADQDSHVALFVDALADHGVSEGIDGEASSLDTAVRATGAIAEHFLLTGDRVSLHVLDSRHPVSVPPGAGARHLRRILDALALVEVDVHGRRTPGTRGPVLPAETVAIMCSPLIAPVALDRAVVMARHGLRVAVVDTLPDDVHASDDPTVELAWRIRLLERQREIRTVRQEGVPVVRWRGRGSLDPFLRELGRRAAAPRMARR